MGLFNGKRAKFKVFQSCIVKGAKSIFITVYCHMCLIANRLLSAQVQHPAPDFQGTAVVDGSFKDLQLSDFKGKYLVLFFYPLDL